MCSTYAALIAGVSLMHLSCSVSHISHSQLVLITSRACLICVDVLLVVITWRSLYQRIGAHELRTRTTFSDVLLRDGERRETRPSLYVLTIHAIRDGIFHVSAREDTISIPFPFDAYSQRVPECFLH